MIWYKYIGWIHEGDLFPILVLDEYENPCMYVKIAYEKLRL